MDAQVAQGDRALKRITGEEKAKGNTEAKKKKGKNRYTPIVPVPVDAPPFDKGACAYHNKVFGKEAGHIYGYSLAGGVAMYVARWDGVKQKDGTPGKEIRPYIYGTDAKGKAGWYSQFLDEPPLYNLPDLIANKKDVLFVEGEKTAEAAKILFPDYTVTTTAGGSGSAHKTDFSPLSGMSVLISPDCGEAGSKYASHVYRQCRKAKAQRIQQFDTLALSKRVVVDGKVVDRDPSTPAKETYDLADALEDGWTAGLMAAHREKFIATYVEVEKDFGYDGPPPSKPVHDGSSIVHAPGGRRFVDGLITIGSDFEVGRRSLEDLRQKHGQVIFTDGDFYTYRQTQWAALEPKELHDEIEKYDGYCYQSPENDEWKVIKLNLHKKNSALHTMEQGAFVRDFFGQAPSGINCANGFIRFVFDEGIRKWTAVLEEHKPEHRQRHTLPGRWDRNAPTWVDRSLHSRLLNGSFLGDADKASKVQAIKELAGSTISGCATKLLQPRAAILLGTQAENGKSQILNMLRGLLPACAISSVTAAKMGDERHILGLLGKLLNASDELSGASAISSEVFKAVITGETVSGRDVYKSRVEFKPVAQHVYATNTLPSFQGGMDRGVQRRLLVLPFNRVIPKEEKIADIGRCIPEEEMNLLLAWAVEGALDLMNNRGFTVTDNLAKNLQDWLEEADSVQGWVAECLEIVMDQNAWLKTSYAYKCYHKWATEQGIKLDQVVGLKNFVRRMASIEGIHHKKIESGRIFLGVNLAHGAPRSTDF
jgi:P4 family phage/plasmid primase-like protien